MSTFNPILKGSSNAAFATIWHGGAFCRKDKNKKVLFVFRICIAGGRRVPVRIKGFTYLFLLHGLIQVLLGFHVHLPLGMTPATSVSTTALNLCRVLIPLLISFIGSSGSVEALKFSLMRLGVLDAPCEIATEAV